jgi:RND family efflux transporter MFP subunit
VKRLLLLAGALALAAALGTPRAQNQASGSVGKAPEPARAVEAPPQQTPPQPASEAPKPAAKTSEPEVAALILAGEETTLSSQMAGRINRISVGLGDHVKKGGRLIEFDCSEQKAQLDAAVAEYHGARETHLSRLRLQALGAAGELEVTVAAAAADKANSQVALRKSQMAYCSVGAPFSGNVARLRVKASESVNVGQPLVDLVNPDSLKAQMFVPAAWIAWLRRGTPLSINVRETGQTFKAHVSKVNARVDGVSQQLELEARIDKGQDRLLPGMVGSAIFDRSAAQ